MTKYTAQDFANARFAELGKYGLRAHKSAGDSYWQRDGIRRATNEEMADAGWVPVPTDLVLTESQVVRVYVAARDNMDHFHRELKLLGFKITPDAEPASKEKWEMFCSSLLVNLAPWQIDYLAKAMDERGVTPPDVKDN